MKPNPKPSKHKNTTRRSTTHTTTSIKPSTKHGTKPAQRITSNQHQHEAQHEHQHQAQQQAQHQATIRTLQPRRPAASTAPRAAPDQHENTPAGHITNKPKKHEDAKPSELLLLLRCRSHVKAPSVFDWHLTSIGIYLETLKQSRKPFIWILNFRLPL